MSLDSATTQSAADCACSPQHHPRRYASECPHAVLGYCPCYYVSCDRVAGLRAEIPALVTGLALAAVLATTLRFAAGAINASWLDNYPLLQIGLAVYTVWIVLTTFRGMIQASIQRVRPAVAFLRRAFLGMVALSMFATPTRRMVAMETVEEAVREIRSLDAHEFHFVRERLGPPTPLFRAPPDGPFELPLRPKHRIPAARPATASGGHLDTPAAASAERFALDAMDAMPAAR